MLISENASLNHLAIADSLAIRDWLNANCEGGKAGWQRWSKKSLLDPTFLSNEEAYWKELVTTLKPETLPDGPTIYAMQGNQVHIHPMTSADAALKFLQGLK